MSLVYTLFDMDGAKLLHPPSSHLWALVLPDPYQYVWHWILILISNRHYSFSLAICSPTLPSGQLQGQEWGSAMEWSSGIVKNINLICFFFWFLWHHILLLFSYISLIAAFQISWPHYPFWYNFQLLRFFKKVSPMF